MQENNKSVSFHPQTTLRVRILTWENHTLLGITYRGSRIWTKLLKPSPSTTCECSPSCNTNSSKALFKRRAGGAAKLHCLMLWSAEEGRNSHFFTGRRYPSSPETFMSYKSLAVRICGGKHKTSEKGSGKQTTIRALSQAFFSSCLTSFFSSLFDFHCFTDGTLAWEWKAWNSSGFEPSKSLLHLHSRHTTWNLSTPGRLLRDQRNNPAFQHSAV